MYTAAGSVGPSKTCNGRMHMPRSSLMAAAQDAELFRLAERPIVCTSSQLQSVDDHQVIPCRHAAGLQSLPVSSRTPSSPAAAHMASHQCHLPTRAAEPTKLLLQHRHPLKQLQKYPLVSLQLFPALAGKTPLTLQDTGFQQSCRLTPHSTHGSPWAVYPALST